jgi:hypothetical protein
MRVFLLQHWRDASGAAHKLANVDRILRKPLPTTLATYEVALTLMPREFFLQDTGFSALPAILLSALKLQVLREFFLRDTTFLALPAPFQFALKLMLREVFLQERFSARTHGTFSYRSHDNYPIRPYANSGRIP